MKVKLKVNIAAAGLPADFTVRDYNGNIVFYRRFVGSENCFCFNTQSRNLIFTVRPLNAAFFEVSKFFRLPCAKCVCAELFYGFSSISPIISQRFTLLDANYLFPISSAMLYFDGNN
ncbi:MAG: hypothetical protein SPL13_02190 [Clostridia bacterium]|nr:hypothetical protein [Clostridia bacterium]